MNFMRKYFERMKNIEEKLLVFLDHEDNIEENYGNMVKILDDENILKDHYDMKIILNLINKISNNHYHCHNFYKKVEQILKNIKNEIIQLFTNDEIFEIFNGNKRVILSLIEEKILTLDQNIYNEIMKFKYKEFKYPEYFAPEIQSFIELEKEKEDFDIDFYNQIQIILKEDFEKFNEKRKKGENDTFLSKIIQNDSIEEFIIFINKENYSIDSIIEKSIFETNEFLNKQKKTSLIEYAAFYGSAQIFKYLYKNDSRMSPKLWLYAIHGSDEEIIHILEDMSIKMKYEECIKESIKCHYSYITNYIEYNYMTNNTNNINTYCFKYYNFVSLYSGEIILNENLFLYACKYDYYKIVEHLVNSKNISVNSSTLKDAAYKNNDDVLTFLLIKVGNEIINNCFDGCKNLRRITIPSSITSIGDHAFSECTSLKQITIPPSVTSIGDYVFRGCTSLTKITILSKLTLIGNSCFKGCSSLTQISIPSTVTSIGDYSFTYCSSLTQIQLPSSLKFLGNNVFEYCSKLTQIVIPPSLKFIGIDVFNHCSKLKHITIPSTFGVNNIGIHFGIKITRY